MNIVDNGLLLLGLPAAMLLAGYWLAAQLTHCSTPARLSAALLTGLAALLWSVATVNFFQPLAGIWAWLCLWPIGLTFALAKSRRALIKDFASIISRPRNIVAVLLGLGFLLALVWPVLSQRGLIFYDGTSNHDSFFWISSAEFLKRHNYLTTFERNAVHPLSNDVPAIIGLKPIWGRMGAEGLLALVSSLTGTSSIKVYICATATLFIPWIAAVYLAVKTFVKDQLSTVGMAVLMTVQPIFIFFHGNSNLPNLLGILTGAAVIIASERAFHEKEERLAWLTLLALSFHGLICAYPEMLPFVLLPGALLWFRRWLTFKPALHWRNIAAVALAYVIGGLINPASTLRAYAGFLNSFGTARANQNWANLFEPLTPTEYLPAMLTLSVRAGRDIGPILGGLFTVGIVICLLVILKRARDSFGTLAMLAGTFALIAYTLETKFNYGWQKAIQFGGVFCAALVPLAVVDYLAQSRTESPKKRIFAYGCLTALLTFCGYATFLNLTEEYKWSRQKLITEDWFKVRDFSRDHLHAAPVLIDGASFRMAFFHGMWATYFLSESDVYFAARGKENGGYLRDSVINESGGKLPPIRAYLVGRDWAQSFDANSKAFVLGDSVALLSQSNRVIDLEGFLPDNGVPILASEHLTLDLHPHSRSQFQLVLGATRTGSTAPQRWTVTCRSQGASPFITQVSGPPPWKFSVPLNTGVDNRVELTTATPRPKANLTAYAVQQIRIETRP